MLFNINDGLDEKFVKHRAEGEKTWQMQKQKTVVM